MGDTNHLNYLTIMKPSVFRHLFKFANSKLMHEVQKSYNLSHDHQTCLDEGTKKDCGDFQGCVRDDITWESATYETNYFVDSDGRSIAYFSAEQMTEIRSHKRHIRHFHILTHQYLMNRFSYKFLLKQLIEENEMLKSLNVLLREEDEEMSKYLKLHPSVHSQAYSRQPSWSLFLATLMEKKNITATLEIVVFYSKESLPRICELFNLPKDDHLCQQLVDLNLLKSELIPGENYLFRQKPELTPFPTAFFLAKLPVLQHIMISAFNLSTSLLQEFVRRGQTGTSPPLRTLLIHAHLKYEGTASYGLVPELSEATWQSLVNTYPLLQLTLSLDPSPSGSSRDCGRYDWIKEIQQAAIASVKLGNDPFEAMSMYEAFSMEEEDDSEEEIEGLCFGAAPQTAIGGKMMRLLKPSAPLVHLQLHVPTVEDFIEVARKSRIFNKTLRMMTVFTSHADDRFVFRLFTSRRFAMRTSRRRVYTLGVRNSVLRVIYDSF